MKKIWTCKIGEPEDSKLPSDADLPMRRAIAKAYKEITGDEPNFIFSGWGGELTKTERELVEETHPLPEEENHGQSPSKIFD